MPALIRDDQRAVGVRRAEFLGVAAASASRSRDAADRAAPHLAVLHQIVDDALREIARHGEADPLIAAALAEDAGVDADQLAARVDQRAARVARVDRRVGLDEVLVVGEARRWRGRWR